MDFKLNLLTPSLYSKEGETNCIDTVVEKFAEYLKHRADNEFSLPCKFVKVPGLAFIHSFEDFEERFLMHSEYAVIIASPYSQKALNQFNARLLVFLTAKPTWQNRFLFVCLGNVKIMSNLVIHEPIYFSLDDWEMSDDESWITLFNMIKITWKPHIDEEPLTTTLNQVSEPSHETLISVYENPFIEDTKKTENTSTKGKVQVKMLETRSTQGSNVTVEHLIFNSENIKAVKTVLFNDSETNTTPGLQKRDDISAEMSDNSDTDSEQTFNCKSGNFENQSQTSIRDIDFEEYQEESDEVFKDGKTLEKEFIRSLKKDLKGSELNASSSHDTGLTEVLEQRVTHNQGLEAVPIRTTQNLIGGNFVKDLETSLDEISRNEQTIGTSNTKSDDKTRMESNDSSIFLDFSLTSNNSLISNGERSFSEKDMSSSKEHVGSEESKKEEKIVHKRTTSDQDSEQIISSSLEQPNDSIEEDFINERIIGTEYKMENFEPGEIVSEDELYDFDPNALNKETSSSYIPLQSSRFDSFTTCTDDVGKDLDLKNEEEKLYRGTLDTQTDFKTNNENEDVEHQYGLGSKVIGKDYIISGKISSITDSETSTNDIPQTHPTTDIKNISKSETIGSDSYGKSDKDSFRNISLQMNNLDSSKNVSDDTENIGNINISMKTHPNLKNEEFQSEIVSLDAKTESKANNRSDELAHDYEVENNKIERFNIVSDQTTSKRDSQISVREGENISESEAMTPDPPVRFGKESYSNIPLQSNDMDSYENAADRRENIDNKNVSSKQKVYQKDESLLVEKKYTFDTKSEDNLEESFLSTSNEAVKVSDRFMHENKVGEQESHIISKQIHPSANSQIDIKDNSELKSSSICDSRYLPSLSDDRLKNIPNDSFGSFCYKIDDRNTEKLQKSSEKDNVAVDANINTRVNENKDSNPTELEIESTIVPEIGTAKENKSEMDDRKLKDDNIFQKDETNFDSQVRNLPSERSTKKDLQACNDDTDVKSILCLKYENENEICNENDIVTETCLKTINNREENEDQIKEYNIRDTEHERMNEQEESMNTIETDQGKFGWNTFIILSSYLWRKIFSGSSPKSTEAIVDGSISQNSLVPGYIRSPWYVGLLFISGTVLSRYWVDWTRRVFPTSISPNIIIGAISSSVIFEEAIIRKWAITSPEQGSFIYPGDPGSLDK